MVVLLAEFTSGITDQFGELMEGGVIMTNKNLIIISQFINDFGSGFSRIALVILITMWYKSPMYVALYTFFLFVPQVVLATPVGVLIDSQQSQKKVLLLSSLVASITILIVAVLAWLQLKSYVLLVILAVIYNIAGSFYVPSITKLTVTLFNERDYNAINAAVSSAMTAANLFSGILVTFALTMLPLSGLFLIDCLSYWLTIGVVVLIHESVHIRASKPTVKSRGSVWNSFQIVTGLLRHLPMIAPVFGAAVLFNILLAPMTVYLTQVATRLFGNSQSLGLMESFFSLGFLISSLVYRRLSQYLTSTRLIQTALVLVPTALMIFGTAKFLLVALAGLILLGMALPLFNITMKTILQKKVPQERLGTIFASYFGLMNLSQPVGLLGIPVLIGLWGISSFMWFGGSLYLIVALGMIITHRFSTALNE